MRLEKIKGKIEQEEILLKKLEDVESDREWERGFREGRLSVLNDLLNGIYTYNTVANKM